MKKIPGLSTLLSCFLMMFVASLGCAHRAAEKTDTGSAPAAQAAPAAKTEMKFKSAYLSFTISPKGVAETEPKPYLEQAQTSCVEQLTSSGLFDTVKVSSGADPKEGAVLVQAELTSLRIVSGAARFWVGAFAGKSDMTFHVKLIDAATGSVIDESDIGSETNPMGGAWTIGGTDRSLPGQVGAHVAEYVAFKTKK